MRQASNSTMVKNKTTDTYISIKFHILEDERIHIEFIPNPNPPKPKKNRVPVPVPVPVPVQKKRIDKRMCNDVCKGPRGGMYKVSVTGKKNYKFNSRSYSDSDLDLDLDFDLDLDSGGIDIDIDIDMNIIKKIKKLKI